METVLPRPDLLLPTRHNIIRTLASLAIEESGEPLVFNDPFAAKKLRDESYPFAPTYTATFDADTRTTDITLRTDPNSEDPYPFARISGSSWYNTIVEVPDETTPEFRRASLLERAQILRVLIGMKQTKEQQRR